MGSVIKKYNPSGVDEGVLRQTGTGGFLSGGYLKDSPIETYLEDQESVVFTLSNSKFGVKYEHEQRDEKTHVRPGDGYRAFAIVTDSRLLFIIGDNEGGNQEGDYSVSIPLADIAVVEAHEGVLAGELVVVTSAEMWWRFSCRADLGPVADYLEAASTTWMRVEARLEDARKYLVDATQYLESRAYDDAMAAVRDAMTETDTARRRERRFCEDGIPAMVSHIERIEERISDVSFRVIRARATHSIDVAEAHWREDAYDAAYRAYSDAREDYLEALSMIDREVDEFDELREKLDRVERNMNYLEDAPIERARTAERHAEEADDLAERIGYLERALDRYRTALELDWGQDIKRFECDTDSVCERVDDVAETLVAARQSRAAAHVDAAEDFCEADRYREAHARYREARESLRAANHTAHELVPDAVDTVTERLAAVDERLAEVRTRLDDPSTDDAELARPC